MEDMLVKEWRTDSCDLNVLNLVDSERLVSLTTKEFSTMLEDKFSPAEVAFIKEKRMKALNNIAAKKHREKERKKDRIIELELNNLVIERDELIKEKESLQLQLLTLKQQN
eukprot:TRINITY_DN5747_c0_g2_i1.p1 TRINITY_DN5747_c0_g2~~TRINITY_DN5747_c0_g2_i1.p1  ORF type:complete len:111 (-),score=14.47 TRINITY_DN5747_c0_g2_i1:136-468(-)